MITPKIIFEDKAILVLDKPAGWVVTNGETVAGQTIENWLITNGIQNAKLLRSGIVHRLDKDTSGILLVTKTTEVLTNLQLQFKTRQVQKKYLALVHGQMIPKTGVIRGAISRSPLNRKKFGLFLGGKEAETEYRILKYYETKILGKYSLVELRPKTGRTHQIRVHLKSIGHPIVSDDFYSGRKTNRQDRNWCPRQFLHAASITFFHPVTGQSISFSSPLPTDLKLALTKIK